MQTHANPHRPNRPQARGMSKRKDTGLQGWFSTFTATFLGRLFARLVEAILNWGP